MKPGLDDTATIRRESAAEHRLYNQAELAILRHQLTIGNALAHAIAVRNGVGLHPRIVALHGALKGTG